MGSGFRRCPFSFLQFKTLFAFGRREFHLAEIIFVAFGGVLHNRRRSQSDIAHLHLGFLDFLRLGF